MAMIVCDHCGVHKCLITNAPGRPDPGVADGARLPRGRGDFEGFLDVELTIKPHQAFSMFGSLSVRRHVCSLGCASAVLLDPEFTREAIEAGAK